MSIGDKERKFVEDELKIKLSAADEEFLKSAINKFVEYGGKNAATVEEFIENNIHVLLRVVEEATMSLRTQIALGKYDLACKQEAAIRNIEARRRNGFTALAEKRSFHN